MLYLVYLCPCLGLSLLMSYLYALFFIFSLISIVINHITSLKQTHLFFVHFLEICFFWMIMWMKTASNFRKIAQVQHEGVA